LTTALIVFSALMLASGHRGIYTCRGRELVYFVCAGVTENASVLLTIVAFFITGTSLVWQPSIPAALIVLAITQMGVHIVFFLHITTMPDSINNVMAPVFCVFIVFVLIVGSLWIMTNLNHNMTPMQRPMQLQR